jgi:hypothetical protein
MSRAQVAAKDSVEAITRNYFLKVEGAISYRRTHKEKRCFSLSLGIFVTDNRNSVTL